MIAIVDRIPTIGTGTETPNRDVPNLRVIPILHKVLNPRYICVDLSQVVKFMYRIAFQDFICDFDESKLGWTDA